MANFSPRTRRSAARLGVGVAVLLLPLFGLWAAGALPGQGPEAKGPPEQVKDKEQPPPPKGKQRDPEEEEEVPTRPKPLLPPKGDPRSTPSPSPVVPVEGDLAQAARKAQHPAVKELYADLAIPHDRVSLAFKGGTKREERVEPLARNVGADLQRLRDALPLQPIDAEGKRGKPFNANPDSVKAVTPYEVVIQDAVRAFLAKGLERLEETDARHLTRLDQYLTAEQVLLFAAKYHGQRAKGGGWEAVGEGLRDQLLEVRLSQLRERARTKQLDEAFALARRLAGEVTRDADKKKLAEPLAHLLAEAAKRGPLQSDDRTREVRRQLLELEARFRHDKEFEVVRARLRAEAEALFESARALAGDDRTLTDAERKLKEALELCPDLKGVAEYLTELRKKARVLKVGVRQLPQFLSPARACTDVELRALDLLFEGLVRALPDAEGNLRYEPGLAVGRPRVVPLGREFRLPAGAAWSNGKPLNSVDVRTSVRLLRQGHGGLSPAWGDLLNDVRVTDPRLARLTLRQGYLEPLSLMTFKIVPRPEVLAGMKDSGPPDSVEFARNPVGSGPYRYAGVRSEEGVSYAVFVANEAYGLRSSKVSLSSRIREIRFYAYAREKPEAEVDAIAEWRRHGLDLALDLTAKQAAALRAEAGNLGLKVSVPGPKTPNRRVYFLAVNQNRSVLRSADLRRALAHAIDREGLLDEFFRKGLGREVHAALNGPYPARSWACNPALSRKDRSEGGSLDPHDAALAKAKYQRHAQEHGKTAVNLTLKYPSGDPELAKAMARLCEQVQETLKAAKGPPLTLTPQEVDPVALRADVEGETPNYELAYYHYDFPDDTYWLGPLLGRRGPAGDNYLGYKGEDVQKLLQETMGRRDVARVQKDAHLLHRKLYEEMPLIPLWQLDPLWAVGSGLQTGPLDPLRVFADVDRWELKP
jgi:ABC-type transport system substrate-binding protein